MKTEKLKNLYANRSKHSNYQILSSRLSTFLPPEATEVKSRFERERLNVMLTALEVKGKSILDIGGNTGFFSLELLEQGAKQLHLYEGNKEHADFVKLASEVLQVEDRMKVTNAYLNFEQELQEKYDIILLLNVLHHVGDDYGDGKLNVDEAKAKMIDQLNSLQHKTDTVVFQLGFNWKGNPKLGLFEGGTKKELIDFIEDGIKETYTVKDIFIAERQGDEIVYNALNENNIKRDDSMGEFLNRPLFILKSK